MNRTGCLFIIPLHISRGDAKEADNGSEEFRFSSVPFPIIAKQEFFCIILLQQKTKSTLFLWFPR
jgi:hypothetical protein